MLYWKKTNNNNKKEGRKEMFIFNDASAHFIYGCMASNMVKDHSDSWRGNPLQALYGLLFSIST